MSTSNFQWRHDGLRWRIKLMQNTPAASLFFAEQGTDMIPSFSEMVEVESVEKPKIYFLEKFSAGKTDMITAFSGELEVVRVDDCSCCNKRRYELVQF